MNTNMINRAIARKSSVTINGRTYKGTGTVLKAREQADGLSTLYLIGSKANVDEYVCRMYLKYAELYFTTRVVVCREVHGVYFAQLEREIAA